MRHPTDPARERIAALRLGMCLGFLAGVSLTTAVMLAFGDVLGGVR